MKTMMASMALAAGFALGTPVTAQIAEAPAGDVPVIDAPPPPIAGVAASYAPPPRDATGGYVTPNRDLTADETLWHVRVALNVAALGCRDAAERQTVADYNALLANARDALAAAQAGMTARYKASFGADWQARNDDAMTKLYNFFAQTTAHDDFCVAAQDALRVAATIEPSDLPTFAAAALPRLEAPFLAFFARYDAYRVTLAAWQARHVPAPVAAPVVLAAVVAPAPVVPMSAEVTPTPVSPPTIIAAAAMPAIIPPQR